MHAGCSHDPYAIALPSAGRNQINLRMLVPISQRGLAVLHFAISAILVWLAINIAFVLLRLRTIRHSAAHRIDGPNRSYPELIPVRQRPGQ